MPQMKFYLFGPPRLERDGQVMPVNGRKALALAVYLAVTGQPQSRDGLATLFWPEFDQTSARANLRRELSHLRTVFGDETLQVALEQISLRRGVHLWLDVAEFHDHWQQCQPHLNETPTACLPQLQEAVRLYSADFLAGFTLPACPAFDEWQFFQSEGYRQTLAAVLEALVQGHQRLGAMEAAIAYAQRRLSLDSLSEPAHRQLITLYAESGQLTAALRQYERCVQLLRAELGVAPEAETTRLIEQIRHKQAHEGLQAKPTTNRGSLALQTSHEVRHNLPTQTTLFVGRNDEIAEIQRLLWHEESCRLLTLVGPGGIGKTRLALAAATQLLSTFADGVYFVPLTPVSAVEFIVPAIAEAIHFNFHGKIDPQEQLLAHLRQRRLLLLIDNFEHLSDGAPLLTEILRHAPAVRLLITSRQRLQLREEWSFAVQGLPFPSPGQQIPESEQMPADFNQYSAVQLFLQRARQAEATFTPSTTDIHDVVRLCQLVEGMPLALELAAPWIRTLRCQEIVVEIKASLDFLTTTLRNLPERHRSLRVVFEQSWQRLSATEQSILQRLAVFRGGCNRVAAEEVAGATLSTLSSLVDKALLRRTASGRYELHELIRQYAEERLQADPQALAQTQARHGTFFITFLANQTQDIKGARQKEVLAAIQTDIDNVRMAWRQAVANQDVEAIAAAAECLFVYYLYGSGYAEGQSELGRAVSALTNHTAALPVDGFPQTETNPDQQASLVGFLLAGQGYLLAHRHDLQAGSHLLEQAITLLRQTRSPKGVPSYNETFALLWLGVTRYFQDRTAEGQQYAQACLSQFAARGDRWGEGWSLLLWGNCLRDGRPAEAAQVYQRALLVCQTSGDQSVLSYCYGNFSQVAIELGEYDQAQHYADQGVQLAKEVGNLLGLGFALFRRGQLEIAQGRYLPAIQTLEESAVCFQEIGAIHSSRVQMMIGVAHHLSGDHARAAQCYTQALATFQDVDKRLWLARCLNRLGCLAYDQGKLHQAEQYQQQSLAILQTIAQEPGLIAAVWRDWGCLLVAAGEQRHPEARQAFHQALALAMEHQLAPLALDVCLGVAELWLQVGALDRAIALFVRIEQYEAATAATRQRARQSLRMITEQHPLSMMRLGPEQARSLWPLVQDLMVELA